MQFKSEVIVEFEIFYQIQCTYYKYTILNFQVVSYYSYNYYYYVLLTNEIFEFVKFFPENINLKKKYIINLRVHI